MRVCLLLLLFSAVLCGFNTIGAPGPGVNAQTASAPMVQLHNHVLPNLYQATRINTPAAVSSPLVAQSAQTVTLTVVLNRSDEAGFQSYLKGSQTPASPSFGQFLSQADLASRFGPSQQTYNSVLSYLQQQGFAPVQGSTNPLTITVQGTRQEAEQAFQISIYDYQLNGKNFFANNVNPSLPANIASDVQAIAGLDNFNEPQSSLGDAPPTPATPVSIATAYNFNSVSVTGAGQKIGLLEFDNYNDSDIMAWMAFYGVPLSHFSQLSRVPVAGGTGPSANTNVVLRDIESVMGTAQGANYVVYNAPLGTSFQTMFSAMIADGDTVIMNSWWGCEDEYTLANLQSIDSVIAQAAASGISVLSATGDGGNACFESPPNPIAVNSGTPVAGVIAVPADSPNATAVGGTNLQVTGPSNRWQSETWWNDAVGSGGFGVSSVFPRPAYQNGFTSAANRSVPDVVADADPATGIIICPGGACTTSSPEVGGTGLATGIWAGAAAIMNQFLGTNLGFLNQKLYLNGPGPDVHPTNVIGDFAHVGLGSPNFAVPGAPTNPSAMLGNAQATVSWSPPATSGPSRVLTYTVTATPPSSSGPVTVPGNTLTATVPGLTNGVSYTFSITATNSFGTGPAATTSAITPNAPATTPTGATCTQAATAYSCQFTLTSPLAPGGTITLTPASSAVQLVGCVGTSNGLTCKQTGSGSIILQCTATVACATGSFAFLLITGPAGQTITLNAMVQSGGLPTQNFTVSFTLPPSVPSSTEPCGGSTGAPACTLPAAGCTALTPNGVVINTCGVQQYTSPTLVGPPGDCTVTITTLSGPITQPVC